MKGKADEPVKGIRECKVCGMPILARGNTQYCDKHGDSRRKSRKAAREAKKNEIFQSKEKR
ncbi:MAG: hypothetical protein K0Q47_65 [Sedimentibacter sp.]|jgi:hypothetical protein|nr:hypothetical protein [Sedimentibacter sp.]